MRGGLIKSVMLKRDGSNPLVWSGVTASTIDWGNPFGFVIIILFPF
jgi:hypothetical protein